MTQLFITSDEHIGHGRVSALETQGRETGIIRLAKRPFKNLDEMKHTLITNHNAKVPNSRGVLTVHVGDLIWSWVSIYEGMDYLRQLNGRHAFLFGNHDEWVEKYRRVLTGPGAFFDYILGENQAGGTKIFTYDKMHVTVDHFAKRVWQGSHKGHGHVYGHSHSALPGLGRSFDIGVDGNNFTPWAIEEIVARLRTLMPHHTINNTGEGMADVVNEKHTRSGICQCDECQGRGSSNGRAPTCNRQVAGSSPAPGSTVHYHKVGETCGFCKMVPTSDGVVQQFDFAYLPEGSY
jgi:calcineurin-like phosphoesterase family protein